jgi:hypothetical protein
MFLPLAVILPPLPFLAFLAFLLYLVMRGRRSPATTQREALTMPSTLAIDTRNTFATALLMSSGPKLEYGTGAQATNAQGIPKWELSVAVTYLTEPGMRAQSEVLAVTCTTPDNPAKDIAPGTSVEFDGLRVGISAPEQRSNDRGSRIVGGKPWFQASGLRPAHGMRTGKADAA